MRIQSISLNNFKSIKELKSLELGQVEVFIGANGSGKSNLISFFEFVYNMMRQNLQSYVKRTGRADSYLYFGQKISPFLSGEIEFLNSKGDLSNRYGFKLLPTQDGGFVFDSETSDYNRGTFEAPSWDRTRQFGSPFGLLESTIATSDSYRNRYLQDFFASLRVFHFHDTSATARVKGFANVNDSEYVREDAGNLAAFLFRLSNSNPQEYKLIEKTIESVAPFFQRFNLRPSVEDSSQINLRWFEKGSDAYFDANNLSDGSLRFICLTTLLMQPAPPDTIIIDEPELGLHPVAIEKVAAMIKSVSVKSQVLVSTQSPLLMEQFEPSQIIVVEREEGQSVFKRFNEDGLKEWLEDYSLGQIWSKNLIGGRPK